MSESTPTSSVQSLAPVLLLSMPQLADPNFHRSVVLLCEHGTEGAFGLVLNRPTETPASEVVNRELDSPPAAQGDALRLWIGGPVEPQRGWILLGEQPADADAVRVCEGVYLSTSADLLRRLLAASPASGARLLTGYAGWGPGQLDAELSASAWLMADVDVDIVFQPAPDRMWEAAIRRLGADPSSLQMSHGVH